MCLFFICLVPKVTTGFASVALGGGMMIYTAVGGLNKTQFLWIPKNPTQVINPLCIFNNKKTLKIVFLIFFPMMSLVSTRRLKGYHQTYPQASHSYTELAAKPVGTVCRAACWIQIGALDGYYPAADLPKRPRPQSAAACYTGSMFRPPQKNPAPTEGPKLRVETTKGTGGKKTHIVRHWNGEINWTFRLAQKPIQAMKKQGKCGWMAAGFCDDKRKSKCVIFILNRFQSHHPVQLIKCFALK